MPFTFSHPAVILPLQRVGGKWFSLTGLVAGSMAPDFEYFIRMQTRGVYGHTIAGLFWFDLPLAIVIAFVFHLIIRNSLVENLPEVLRSRFRVFTLFSWTAYIKKHWLVVIVSVLTGAGSHLLWDAFTHEHGYFAGKIPALQHRLVINGAEIPVYKILQHLSTLAGGIVIAYAVWRLPAEKETPMRPGKRYWRMVLLIALLVLVVRCAAGLDYHRYGDLVVSPITAVFVAMVITPLLMKKRSTWK